MGIGSSLIYAFLHLTLQVGDLSTLRSLKRLDLAQNSIQSTSFAATCTGLKWLSLAHNPVSDLSPLSCLQSLQARLILHARGLPLHLMVDSVDACMPCHALKEQATDPGSI